MRKVLTVCCLLCLLISICCPILVSADNEITADGLIYRKGRDGWSVTGYTDSLPATLNIPSTLDGEPVVAIQKAAFFNCTSLTEVTIPDSVAAIGENAFEDCSNLVKVALPKNLTTLELRTFARCSALKTIAIPAGVTTIGIAAFEGCTNLNSVTIPEGVCVIGMGAFASCKNLRSITLPDSITHIGEAAFADIPALYDTAYRYDGVVYFGNHAISHIDPDYEEVRIRKGTKTIASYAFHRSGRLRSLLLPDSIAQINSYAFLQCGRFDVFYAGSQAEQGQILIDDMDDGNAALRNASWHYDADQLPSKSTATTTTTIPTTTTTTASVTTTTDTAITTEAVTSATETASTTSSIEAETMINDADETDVGNHGDVAGFVTRIVIGIVAAAIVVAVAVVIILKVCKKK